MSLNANDKTLFKFVSVRPPKKELSSSLFISFPTQMKDSWAETMKFLFEDNEQSDKLKKHAKSFIESNQFYLSNELHATEREDIDKVTRVIESQTKLTYVSDKMVQEIEAIFTTNLSEYTQTKTFLDIKQNLWDSMLASSFYSSQEETQKNYLLQTIRTVHILENIVSKEMEIDSYESLNKMKKKIPVFPKSFHLKPENIKDDDYSNMLEIQKERQLKSIQKTYEQMVNLKNTVEELVHLEKEHKSILLNEFTLDEVLTKENFKDINLSIKDLNLPIKNMNHMIKQEHLEELIKDKEDLQLVYTKLEASPWVLSPRIIKSISAETKEVLKQNNINVNDERIKDIQAELYNKISETAENLLIESDQQNMVGIDQKLMKDKSYRVNLIKKAIPNIDIDFKNYIPFIPELFIPDLLFPDPYIPEIPTLPSLPSRHSFIKPLGIGDLKIVQQKLLKYEEGEVSHIENVLKSEFKERKHRRLRQTEESTLYIEEIVKESEQDLQSTERFSLEREAHNIIQSDMKTEAGLTVTGGYGPVKIEAHGNISTAESEETAKKASSSYAKDITQRALSRIKERVHTERTQKSLDEIEEINTHNFDNTQGTEHAIGVYRWVDKVYEAKIINYGKRQMFSFVIPEPAAFYIHAQDNKKHPDNALQPPHDIRYLKPEHILRYNYMQLVRDYELMNVNPPPSEYLYVGGSLHQDQDPDSKLSITIQSKNIEIPNGYQASNGSFESIHMPNSSSKIKPLVGARHLDVGFGGKKIQSTIPSANYFRRLDNMKSLPISVMATGVHAYLLNYEIECICSPERYEAWQLEVYGKVIEAHEKQLSDYNEQISEHRIGQERKGIYGDNPNKNRIIEKDELKKLCLQYMRIESLDQFEDVSLFESSPYGYPEMDLFKSFSKGEFIQFFEHAFEWEHMTYVFYPYFWGDKSKWIDTMHYSNQDPLFEEFLKAGASRVVIPVRPGYDESVLHYLITGEIWKGEGSPLIDDEMYVSIINEIKKGNADEDSIIEGEPWEIRVPTSLVKLQTGSTLPDFTQKEDG